MWYIKWKMFDQERYFCKINDEHFIASYCDDSKDAKSWKTKKLALLFFKKWSGAGIGLNGEIVEVKET